VGRAVAMSAARGAFDPGAVAAALERRLQARPRALLVLGSGLGGVVERVEAPVEVAFEELPGMPSATVAGHAGRFVGGRLAEVPVLVQAGRYHAYEGHPMDVVAGTVRVAVRLGVEAAVLTNAAGGVRPDLAPGDLLLIRDHVNLMGRSPLIGPPGAGERRFPDMSEPYDPRLAAWAHEAAGAAGIELREGVYGAVLGPAFETAAEVRALAVLGVDAVGMSTVPEVLAARALGLPCLAISMITNRATGLADRPLDHAEVLAVGRTAAGRVEALLQGFFALLGAGDAQSTGAK